MYVSARERKVIDLLLQSQDDLPIKQIADLLEVSSRTVHRDLKGIEEVLESHQLTLQKKTGSGLAILGNDENRHQLRRSISDQKALDYTPEERQVLILSRLLDSSEPVKLLTFASELGVTAATISHDLDKIENDITGYQLELIRKRGYGVEIQGDESNIRDAISHLIMHHLDELDFLKLLRDHIQGPASPTLDSVSDHLLGLVNKETITTIEQTVESIRPILNYHLADSAYIGLVIHLALAIERLRQGEFIRMEDGYLDELRPAKEFEVASQLIRKLEEVFNLNIPEAETGYITMHLMGAKVRYDQTLSLEESSLSIAFKAKQMIEFVSKEMNQNLHQSDQLLGDLVVHLKPSVYRIQQKMDIQNPLMDQIEGDYPQLFTILENAVEQVFPSLIFPKEETAFLVMHFASALLNMSETIRIRVMVVCSSGIGTAKILAAKLKQQFFEIEEVEHKSLFDLEKINLHEYDLIVSTVPLRDRDQYVLVNPMLPQSDVHKLEHAIRRVKIGERMRKVEKSPPPEVQTLQAIKASVSSIQNCAEVISQLLNHLKVLPVKTIGKQEVITEACEHLERKGAVTNPKKVEQALLEREKAGGLGIPGSSIALFHTRLSVIPESSFTILTLQEPVSILGMDGEMMPVRTIILMLAPEKVKPEGLEVLSFLSSILVEDPESISILDSHEEESITKYLSNQVHQFFQKKMTS